MGTTRSLCERRDLLCSRSNGDDDDDDDDDTFIKVSRL